MMENVLKRKNLCVKAHQNVGGTSAQYGNPPPPLLSLRNVYSGFYFGIYFQNYIIMNSTVTVYYCFFFFFSHSHVQQATYWHNDLSLCLFSHFIQTNICLFLENIIISNVLHPFSSSLFSVMVAYPIELRLSDVDEMGWDGAMRCAAPLRGVCESRL